MQVEPFKPQDNVKIETDPNAKEPKDSAMHADDGTRIDELCAELDTVRGNLPEGFRVAAISFEKDDDSNFHMDLITSLANMRARNYSIGEVSFNSTLYFRVKRLRVKRLPYGRFSATLHA